MIFWWFTMKPYCSTERSISPRQLLLALLAGAFLACVAGSPLSVHALTLAEASPAATVSGDYPPVNVSIVPSDGVLRLNEDVKITTVYEDADGAGDIVECRLLLNTRQSPVNGVFLRYDAQEHKLYLRDDTDKDWLGGVAPGSRQPDTYENSGGRLNVYKTTVERTETQIKIVWWITIKTATDGQLLRGWMICTDLSGNDSGFEQVAEYLPNDRPVSVSLIPSSGVLPADSFVFLASTFRHIMGADALYECYLFVNAPTNGVNGAYVKYDANANRLDVSDDAGVSWITGYPPGSPQILETSHAALDCSRTTITASGMDLTINWCIQFKNLLSSHEATALHMAFDDRDYPSGDWQEVGAYIIDQTPTNAAFENPDGQWLQAGKPISFTTRFSDADGSTDIAECAALINTTPSAAGAPCARYDAQANLLYLRNAADTDWLGGFAPGSANVIENEYAALYCEQTSVAASGDNLSVTWRVLIKAASAPGPTKAWLRVTDVHGLVDGWEEMAAPILRACLNKSLTPSSGSVDIGTAVKFESVHSFLGGYSHVTDCRLLLNTGISGINAVFLWYDVAANRIWLKSDDGSKWFGGHAPGSENFIANSQCLLSCAETKVTGTGSDLAISWSLMLKQPLAGKQMGEWMYTADDAGGAIGWEQMGSIFVSSAGADPPVTGTISPSSGSLVIGPRQQFTATFTDLDGASDIAGCRVLINTDLSSARGIFLDFDLKANRMFLRDDLNTAWLGGHAPGSANTIENSQCKIYCEDTLVQRDGSTVTITISVELKPILHMRLLKQWLYAKDITSLSDGWNQAGSFTAVLPGPVNTSVTPASGYVAAPGEVTFTTVQTDLGGGGDIKASYLLINATPDGKNAIYLYYDAVKNQMFLRNDANTVWYGGVAPGSANTTTTLRADLLAAQSSAVVDGNSLTVSWRLRINQPMKGRKCGLYLYAVDKSNQNTGFQKMGEAVFAQPPVNASLTPASGSALAVGSRVPFTATCTDADGNADISNVYLVINTVLDSKNAISLWYDAAANKLYLRNDANTAWLGGYAPGTAMTIENASCKVLCGLATIERDGPALRVNWMVEPKTSMLGKAVGAWMYVSDASGITDGYDRMAGYTFGPGLPPVNVGLAPAESDALAAGARSTLSATYRDPDGYQSISGAYVVINSVLSSANAISLWYDAAANKLYVRNDANTAWLGGFAPGAESSVIENASCKVDCFETTVNGVGDTLQVNWRIEPKAPTAGRSVKGWLYSMDSAGNKDGYDEVASYTIGVPALIKSMVPINATVPAGWGFPLTTVVDAPNGKNAASCYLLLNTTLSPAGAVYLLYDGAANKMYMRNDAGTAWLEGRTPGETGAIISNSKARLQCQYSSATLYEGQLWVFWYLEFTSSASGSEQKAWMYSLGGSGLAEGWRQMGTLKVDEETAAPHSLGLSLSGGMVPVNSAITTSSWHAYSADTPNIAYCDLLIGETLDAAEFAWFYYDAGENLLWMRNDADDDWVGGFAPESDNVIETSFARLNCAQTAVQPSTSHLTIKWSFDLKPAMAGRRLGAWIQTTDTADNTNGWGQFGDFFAGAITPAVISTSKGDIALDLYDDETPLTVANFKRLAKLGFFNGLNFHRVEDWVAQGGDGEASGRLATSIPLEPNWYRSFADVGQIGMARTDYIHSADSQFYINTKIADWLDPTSDTNGYSLFGAVTGGMDVAASIAAGDIINSVVITEGP
jgi:peptidyl-prolyl cis-trans isomerase B (cyclophilin B)